MDDFPHREVSKGAQVPVAFSDSGLEGGNDPEHLFDVFERGCAGNFKESFNDGHHALDKLETSQQSLRNETMLPKYSSFGSSYFTVLAASSQISSVCKPRLAC